MRLFVALVFATVAPVTAQHDLSLWGRNASGATDVIPWYLSTGKARLPLLGERTVIDARYNFDWKKAAGAYVGRSFGGPALTLIPEIGIIAGRYNGAGPELLVLSTKGRFNLFSQNQYVKGFGRHSDWAYQWTEVLIQANSWLYLGWGVQAFHEFSSGSAPEVDEGPAAKIVLTKVFGRLGARLPEGQSAYLKVWPSRSDGPANRGRHVSTVGIGYSF